MTTLLSIALATVLTVAAALAVLALLATTVLLVLLSVLVLDRVLERNGVDRRDLVRRLWRRLRGPAAPPPAGGGPTAAREGTRTPFSSRFANRSAPKQASAPEQAAPAEAAGEPPADAPTEVLPVPGPVEARLERGARPSGRRPAGPARPVPPEEEQDDRASAIERLFAPLLEDRTEPPGTTPPPRSSRSRNEE